MTENPQMSWIFDLTAGPLVPLVSIARFKNEF